MVEGKPLRRKNCVVCGARAFGRTPRLFNREVRSPHVGLDADDGDLFSVLDIPIISRRVENK